MSSSHSFSTPVTQQALQPAQFPKPIGGHLQKHRPKYISLLPHLSFGGRQHRVSTVVSFGHFQCEALVDSAAQVNLIKSDLVRGGPWKVYPYFETIQGVSVEILSELATDIDITVGRLTLQTRFLLYNGSFNMILGAPAIKSFLLCVNHQLNVGQLNVQLSNYQCLPPGGTRVEESGAQESVYVFVCQKVGNNETVDNEQMQGNEETAVLLATPNLHHFEKPKPEESILQSLAHSKNDPEDAVDKEVGIVSPIKLYKKSKEKKLLFKTESVSDNTEVPLQKLFNDRSGLNYSDNCKSCKMLVILLFAIFVIIAFHYMFGFIFREGTCHVVTVGYNYTTNTAQLSTPCLALNEAPQKVNNYSSLLPKAQKVRADWQICVQGASKQSAIDAIEQNCKLEKEMNAFDGENNFYIGPVKHFPFSLAEGGCVDQLNRTMTWQASFCGLPQQPKQYVQVKENDVYAYIYCYHHKQQVGNETIAFENVIYNFSNFQTFYLDNELLKMNTNMHNFSFNETIAFFNSSSSCTKNLISGELLLPDDNVNTKEELIEAWSEIKSFIAITFYSVLTIIVIILLYAAKIKCNKKCRHCHDQNKTARKQSVMSTDEETLFELKPTQK